VSRAYRHNLNGSTLPPGAVQMEVQDITLRFGGVRALDGVTFTVAQGDIHAIIGPNGAGKTTMMDVITGKTRPNEGTALFEGSHDLTALDEAAIAELGIGRKFQTPTVFEMHSVEDNILLALKENRSPFATLLSRRTARERERIEALLERVRLTAHRHRKAGELSHGQKQWLEIGMLLAQQPKLLLIDEPAAGMTDQETADTADLLRDIAKTQAVVVVEHDMTFVRDLDVKVTCLHEGTVLAEGTLDAVSANERVVEVYLGR
jgi:urea transport system ATP-binding protein